MKNREIFQRDPATAKLLNDGVAAVTESATTKEIETRNTLSVKANIREVLSEFSNRIWGMRIQRFNLLLG
jgi:hypothetical protein